MSASYDKGRDFEREVASVIRRKIDPTAKRDSKSGALDHRKSDIFTELPISIECKDHETIKVREFFRQAKAGARMGEMPAAVFPIDNQITALVPFEDLINLFVEIRDLQSEVDMLREPVTSDGVVQSDSAGEKIEGDIAMQIQKATAHKVAQGVKTCGNGHIISSGRQCLWKGCKYSSSFNAKKAAKGNKKK